MTVHLPPEPPSWLTAPQAVPPVYGYQRATWPVPVAVKRDRGPGPHDTVLSSVLIGVSFVLAATGVAIGVLLQSAVQAYYERLGAGYFASGSVTSAQGTIVASEIVLFVASAALTLYLMKKKRRSFYLPLAALTLAAVVFWCALIPVLYADYTLGSVA
jgi:uncharacterized membrane protein